MKSFKWAVIAAGFMGAVLGFSVLTEAADPAMSPKEKSVQAPSTSGGSGMCHGTEAKQARGHCAMGSGEKSEAAHPHGHGCCSK